MLQRLQECYSIRISIRIWWIMYIRLLVACAAMLLSLLCFDGIGADDHNYIAAEKDVSFMSLPAETQDAVIEAVGEGVMFTPMAGRSLDCTPMPLSFVGGRTAVHQKKRCCNGGKNKQNPYFFQR